MRQKIYLVRTALDFIEVFRRPPRWDTKREEWMDFGRVYVFGTLYWRLDALRMKDLLVVNVPRSMSFAIEQESAWTFCRNDRLLDFFVEGERLETYCWKTMRALGFHHLPVGRRIAVTFDPVERETWKS